MRVPTDLVPAFGRPYIVASLHTTDHTVASHQGRQFASQATVAFDRCRMLRMQAQDYEKIRHYARDFLKGSLAAMEMSRGIAVKTGVKPQFAFWTEAQLEDWIATARQAFEEKGSCVDPLFAAPYLEKGGFKEGSEEHAILCREMSRALIQVYETELKRKRGQYTSGFDDLLTPVPSPAPASSTPKPPAGPKCSVMLQRYTEIKRQERKHRSKTADTAAQRVGMLIRVLGDRPLAAYSRDDLLNFRGTLLRLPPRWSTAREYRGKSLDEVLSGKHPGMSVSNVNTITNWVATFFSWAVTNDCLDKSPATGLKIATATTESEERDIYTPEELESIFIVLASHPHLNPSLHPERVWLPMIIAHSALRPSEIAQLHLADINSEGIPYFDINSEGDKSVKTKSGKRVVPIHPTLIDYGFLDYVAAMRSRNQERLFPKLTKGRDGYATKFGKWFQDFNRRFITSDRRKVFYSIRHSVITQLGDAGVDTRALEDLDGHAHSGSQTNTRYRKKAQAQKLLKAVKKINLGIDFSPMREVCRLTYQD
jgi:integrase